MCVPPSSSQPPPPLPPPPPPPRSSSSQASSIYAGRFFVLPPACCCFGSFPFLRVLLLCSRSVDPFALSRTAWHTRGQRNDGMGRDGTSEDRGQRKRFSLLPQFFLSLSFPFPPFSFFTAHTPFCVHHSAFFIPHTAYCLYSNTFDTHSFSLSLSCYSSFYPSLFSVRRFRDWSLFNAFPFLLVTVKRAEYANAAILCYACGPRV